MNREIQSNERLLMNPSRLFIASITAVMVLALMLCGPPMADAQTRAESRAERVSGAYAEDVDVPSGSASYTTLILHENGTLTLTEVSATGAQTFVGAWSFVDGETIEATAIGAKASMPGLPGITPPPVEINERSYMIVFENRSYQAGTVTSTSGASTSFAIRRIVEPADANTDTDTETETDTDTDTGTETDTNTDTNTSTDTETSTDTDTSTKTDTSTETSTGTETSTETETETETSTNTETATETEESTGTETSTETGTEQQQ